MLELTLVIKQPFQLESEGEVVMAIWNLFIGLLLATNFGFLEVWWRLFFKLFFSRKCIRIKFFYFKKIIFDIDTSK
jgi:hypothetical protein